MSSRPASHLQLEKRSVTPLVKDVVFSERWVGHTRNIPQYGTPHLSTQKWPNHFFVFFRERQEPDVQDAYDFFYAAKRDTQDLYNFSFAKSDIGGNRFDSVVRSYVTLRSEFDPSTPPMGSPMPNVPADLFVGDYVLAKKSEMRIGEQVLDSMFVAEELTYVKRCNIYEIGVDSLNGKSLITEENLFYASEVVTGELTAAQLFADPTNAYWGLQENGYHRVGKQLSCEWYLIESRQVVGGTFADGVIEVDEYSTNDNFFWPPVLETYEIMKWVRNDGGVEVYPALRFHPDGYNGPCKNTITRKWSKTPFDIPVVDILKPTRIYYASPFYTVNIPPCLHNELFFQADIGNSDPVYAQNVNSKRYFAATNPDDENTWPATLVAYDDQEPFRGGFLRTTRVIDSPAIPANVNWLTGAAI